MTADNNQSAQPNNDFNKRPQKLHLAASGAAAFEELVGQPPLSSKGESSLCHFSRCLAGFLTTFCCGNSVLSFYVHSFVSERAESPVWRLISCESDAESFFGETSNEDSIKKDKRKEFERGVVLRYAEAPRSPQDGRSNRTKVLQASRCVTPSFHFPLTTVMILN